ncbi:MAG: hypothetical protein AAGG79_08135 [Pseudomonadota bacterium]
MKFVFHAVMGLGLAALLFSALAFANGSTGFAFGAVGIGSLYLASKITYRWEKDLEVSRYRPKR